MCTSNGHLCCRALETVMKKKVLVIGGIAAATLLAAVGLWRSQPVTVRAE